MSQHDLLFCDYDFWMFFAIFLFRTKNISFKEFKEVFLGIVHFTLLKQFVYFVYKFCVQSSLIYMIKINVIQFDINPQNIDSQTKFSEAFFKNQIQSLKCRMECCWLLSNKFYILGWNPFEGLRSFII